jgi:hypothetical protein
MAFIALRKLINGFPVGKGDEVGKWNGGEFIIAPNANEWRVIIFYAGSLVNTKRIPHINAARSYAISYLEQEHGRH